MAVFEAVETRFPRGLPERFVAALSVRVVKGRWAVRLNVRRGLDRDARRMAEDWALREVLQFRAGGTDSLQGRGHADAERLLVMREFATLEDLPGSSA
jgi:hypothetical protein